MFKQIIFLSVLLTSTGQSAFAEESIIDPASPFRLGEGFPETPATCENLPSWIERAPMIDGRISMTITGHLEESHWDGALAYLIMCKPSEVQVLCVTYAPHEVDPSKSVLLAGGYERVGENRVMLDPCLAYDE